EVFSAPIFLGGPDSCPVELWQADDTANVNHTQLCGIVDVNGDGIMDRVNYGAVQLGTGRTTEGTFFTDTMFYLPGHLATQVNPHNQVCPGAPARTRYTTESTSGLVDLTGDGIPDYVYKVNGEGGSWAWYAYIGTGTGFGQWLVIEDVGDNHRFSLS